MLVKRKRKRKRKRIYIYIYYFFSSPRMETINFFFFFFFMLLLFECNAIAIKLWISTNFTIHTMPIAKCNKFSHPHKSNYYNFSFKKKKNWRIKQALNKFWIVNLTLYSCNRRKLNTLPMTFHSISLDVQ